MRVPRKILVVDDDPAARTLVEEVLADAGFLCAGAGSGREALAAIDGDREIAVVVSDVVMPGLDGVRLGRFIRDRFPDRTWLQVLFITAHAQLELAVSALRLGAVDYLTKPVAPDELVFAVGRALAASRAIAASLPAGDGGGEAVSAGAAPGPNGAPDGVARSTLDYLAGIRRLRQGSGPLNGLDEASWTILLEVYRAEITGRRLSVSKLCALDEASQTTAWRRIRSMEEAGLLLRDQDPADARRSFVTLTESTGRAMAEFMARADQLMTGRNG
jgi:CheY-like chemotaxis protein/DNA-binding MarR family transcriptional regulator